MKIRSHNARAFLSALFFTVLIAVTLLAALPGRTMAQKPSPSEDAALEDALWSCLHDRSPGVERDASDHIRAFNPNTGQNFVYDKDKKAWIDAKTGECICPKCPPKDLEDALWFCLKYRSPGVERDASDHTRAFNPKTGQNFVYDKDKQAWIDAKTGECICPKCPPKEAAKTTGAVKPVSRPQFYADVQGGVSIPTGAGLNSAFHDFDADVGGRINGAWTNPGNQGVGGRIGVNVGWWANDDPASFWSHIGGNFNFSYNPLNFQRSGGTFHENIDIAGLPLIPASGTVDFGSRGNLYSLAYLFNYRQGVLPDAQVPFGRLQFYAGLGPALIINNQKFTRTTNLNGTTFKQSFASQTDTSAGLTVQVGAKYFFTKNFYTNLSFDYRYFQSSFDLTQGNFGSKLNYGNNLLGLNFGAGFQF